jgi:hypothetical protein
MVFMDTTTETDEKNASAFDWIKARLAEKRTVVLSRQFYGSCKHIKISPKCLSYVDTFLRIKNGKLQVREGKSFFDVLGTYRVAAQ